MTLTKVNAYTCIIIYWFGQLTYEQYYFLTVKVCFQLPIHLLVDILFSYINALSFYCFKYGHKSSVQHWLIIIKSTTIIYQVSQAKFPLAAMRTPDSQVARLSKFKLCTAWLGLSDIFTAFLDDSWEGPQDHHQDNHKKVTEIQQLIQIILYRKSLGNRRTTFN